MLLWLQWSLADDSGAQVGSARSATNRRPAHRGASHHYTGNRRTTKPDDRRRTFRRGRHGRRSLEDESSLASQGTKQSRAQTDTQTRVLPQARRHAPGGGAALCCSQHVPTAANWPLPARRARTRSEVKHTHTHHRLVLLCVFLHRLADVITVHHHRRHIFFVVVCQQFLRRRRSREGITKGSRDRRHGGNLW